MSQVDRVLAALRNGPLNTADFLAPNVCDGGKPIIRLAARIHDLQERGYRVETRRRLNSTVDYFLVGEPEGAHGKSPRASVPTGAGSATTSAAESHVPPAARLFPVAGLNRRNAAMEDAA